MCQKTPTISRQYVDVKKYEQINLIVLFNNCWILYHLGRPEYELWLLRIGKPFTAWTFPSVLSPIIAFLCQESVQFIIFYVPDTFPIPYLPVIGRITWENTFTVILTFIYIKVNFDWRKVESRNYSVNTPSKKAVNRFDSFANVLNTKLGSYTSTKETGAYMLLLVFWGLVYICCQLVSN